MDTYSQIINKDEAELSYIYQFYITIRYNLPNNLCLVYRNRNKAYGESGDKKNYNNIYDAGNIDDLILTFTPNAAFNLDDVKDGIFTNTYL